jgi:acetyltransferase-like isoleucine patch superfamily enzyme
VTLFLGGEHRTDRVSVYPARLLGCAREITENDTASKGGVRIGNDVWIGEGATVLSGVSVGNGAVVGAHSVVTKNVSPYAIVAGNPARLLRFRFSPSQVAALERISWWNWPIEDIRSSSHLLFSSEIDEFINLFDPLTR